MLTKEEMEREFWMLTKGILADERVELDEARVLKRWLEEHAAGGDFAFVLTRLDKYLADGWIDRFESKALTGAIGEVLRILRRPAAC